MFVFVYLLILIIYLLDFPYWSGHQFGFQAVKISVAGLNAHEREGGVETPCRDHKTLMWLFRMLRLEVSQSCFCSVWTCGNHCKSQEMWIPRYGYGSIPINTIFRGLFTSINPSYFDVNYRGTIGFDTLPCCICRPMCLLSTDVDGLCIAAKERRKSPRGGGHGVIFIPRSDKFFIDAAGKIQISAVFKISFFYVFLGFPSWISNFLGFNHPLCLLLSHYILKKAKLLLPRPRHARLWVHKDQRTSNFWQGVLYAFLILFDTGAGGFF